MANIEFISCNRCGKDFSVRSMQADLSGKGLVCQNCYNLISQVRTDADRLIQKRLQVQEKERAKGKAREREKRSMGGKEYFCKSCNYRFLSTLPVKICPYCSEEGRLREVEEVVKEIDDILKR